MMEITQKRLGTQKETQPLSWPINDIMLTKIVYRIQLKKRKTPDSGTGVFEGEWIL